MSLLTSTGLEECDWLGQGLRFDGSVIEFACSPTTNECVVACGHFVISRRVSAGIFEFGPPDNATSWMNAGFHLLRVKDVREVNLSDPADLLLLRKKDAETIADYVMRSVIVRCVLIGSYLWDSRETRGGVSFSADSSFGVSPTSYHLFRPGESVLHAIANGTVDPRGAIDFGLLRVSEDPAQPAGVPSIHVSMLDIRGKRTAMFGKTRMGKSNVVKLLVQGMLDVSKANGDVGQLIFDVNGEYANSNPQDGNEAIASAYADRCTCYFLTSRGGNATGKLLRFNFYERTHEALSVMKELLPPDLVDTEAVRNLLTCRLPAFSRGSNQTEVQFLRQIRKIMIFWTLLYESNFEVDPVRLGRHLSVMGVPLPFNCGFTQQLRMTAFQAGRGTVPPKQPASFAEMVAEILVITQFARSYPNDPALLSNDGNFMFDGDEEIMIEYMFPTSTASGAHALRACLPYHSPSADDFIADILNILAAGNTVIVDLGSANEQIIRYFAKSLSIAVFHEQERKFVSNSLHGRYVQIYFEEAHMIFPPNSGNVVDVYSRFAKEGAKFHIGIVYSTQSPSTVNRDLLAQTENFFIGHLSSRHDVEQLSLVQHAFRGLEESILRYRTPGLQHLLTFSHRYVVMVQANRYNGTSRLLASVEVR